MITHNYIFLCAEIRKISNTFWLKKAFKSGAMFLPNAIFSRLSYNYIRYQGYFWDGPDPFCVKTFNVRLNLN